MRGPTAAVAAAFCKNLRRVRSKCQLVFIRRLLLSASRPVIGLAEKIAFDCLAGTCTSEGVPVTSAIGHSALILASRMIGHHFSISDDW
jgi:hypothetical protein